MQQRHAKNIHKLAKDVDWWSLWGLRELQHLPTNSLYKHMTFAGAIITKVQDLCKSKLPLESECSLMPSLQGKFQTGLLARG